MFDSGWKNIFSKYGKISIPMILLLLGAFNISYLYPGSYFFVLFLHILHFLTLGEFIDFQFKIYFQVNSSLDRFIYRFFAGMIMHQTLIYVLTLFVPQKEFSFFAYYLLLAIEAALFFYMQKKGNESSFGQKNIWDLKFLDSFEKTILLLSLLCFIFSFPELSYIPVGKENVEKFLSTHHPYPPQGFHPVNFDYFSLLYNIKSYQTKIHSYVIFLHLYLLEYGTFLLSIYSLFRFYFSRRSALLGVFAILTTWRLTKVMALDFGTCLTSMFPFVWLWGIVWSNLGKSYRLGLFLGLLAFWGLGKNIQFIYLIIPSLLYMYKIEFKDRTPWFLRQHFKYFILTFFFCMTFFFIPAIPWGQMGNVSWGLTPLFVSLKKFFLDKGFFIISIFVPFIWQDPRLGYLTKQKGLLFYFSFILLFFLLFQKILVVDMAMGLLLSFLCLIPVEWFFLVHSKSRSFRNGIYLAYILICLLDSHFEGRLKYTFTWIKKFSALAQK